jgi:hypothetical protein
MPIFIRFFSGLVTALPAIVFWQIIVKILVGDYSETTYLIVSYSFLAVSLLLGFFVPALVPAQWKRYPTLWLFGQGLLSWLAAVMALGVLNFTPLCVGRENGDGVNNISMCAAQTVMVPIAYSPLEFALLCLTTLPGGWLIKQLVKSEAS